MRTRAFVNGLEVTRRCFYADDQRGIARVYRENEQGHIYYDFARNEAAWMELRGQVRLERAS